LGRKRRKGKRRSIPMKIQLDKWDDVAFGFRISKSLIVIEFWKYSLVIDLKKKEVDSHD